MLFRCYFLIKLYMNTWKSRVQTDVYRCNCVIMGVYGCVGAQGARGVQKQGEQGLFMVSRVGIVNLWPGKFPRT